MTFARVATYSVQKDSIEELTRRVNETLVPLYKQQTGFQSLSVVDAGETVVSISHWDSGEHAQEGAQAAIGWAKEQSDLMDGSPQASYLGTEIVAVDSEAVPA
jgi:heme-degrading monooxygenase HmoA